MSTRTNNSPYITSSDSKLQLSFTRFECKKIGWNTEGQHEWVVQFLTTATCVNMATNDTFTNTNLSTTNQHRSVFLCPERLNPNADLNNTTFSWILVAIIFITCPFTVLFNSLVIVALKKRRELEKRSNILLCSMAVTDLLTGAITMPLSATYELLILSQVPFQDICPIQLLVNKLMIFSLSTSSLYHLTAIAWERKMAVKSWIKYRNNVTEKRLTRLAIAVWLFGVITRGPTVLIAVADVHGKFLSMWLKGESVLMVCCLAAIGYFYFMIFLEVRKRDRNQINQVAFLAKTRLESRVAKTTAMITVAIVLSFVPFTSTAILVNIFPAFRTYPVYRFAETVVQFNSLVSPIMYSYRDKRFRNAILELLGVKKLQQRVDGRRNLRRRESVGLVNLAEQTQGTLAPLSKRSASVEPPRNPKMQLRRSLSHPTLTKCDKTSIAQSSKLELQQRATISMTSAAIHHERSKSHGTRKSQRRINAALSIARQTSVVSPKGMVNPSRVLSSKSWDNRAKGNISNSRQKSQLNETTRRPKTAPSNVIHSNEKTAQHKVLKKLVTNCPECPFWRGKLLTHKQCKRDVKDSNSFFFPISFPVFCSRFFFLFLWSSWNGAANYVF